MSGGAPPPASGSPPSPETPRADAPGTPPEWALPQAFKHDPDVPARVLFRWFQSEERLYPVAMVVPERYQAAVRLVGRLTDQLRASCPDLPSLVGADADGEVLGMAERLASFDPETSIDLDLKLVAGAACSIRYRELAANRGS